MSENKCVTLWEKILYGYGGMFTYMISGTTFLSMYWMFFLTTVAGVSAPLAATAATAVTAIKAVVMAVAGAIIDGTKPMKWGKYRGWFLVGNIILLLFTGILFLKWDYKNEITYVIVLLVLYFLQQVGYNISWTASRALVGVMAKTSVDGVGLSAAANIGSTAAGILYGIITPIVMGWFVSKGSLQYMFATLVFSVLLIPGTIAMMKVSAPYENGDMYNEAVAGKGAPKAKVSFKEMMASFNGPGAPYLISSTIMNAAGGFQQMLLVYYTTYVLQKPTVATTATSLGSVAGFVMSLLTPWICSKTTKKNVYFWCLFIGGLLYAVYYFIGTNATLFLLLRVITTLVTTPIGTAMVAMANDIADWDEMQGYASAKGFVQSMMGLTIRIGMLISTAASTFGLVAVGYVSGTVPEGKVLDGIMKMMAFPPCFFYILGALLILFYKLDEKEIEQYRISKLEAAKQAAAE